jgi:hypothetical protein
MNRDTEGELNPYAPPSAAIKPSNSESESSESRLFFRWEKLRLLYNAILGIETALLMVVFPPPSPIGSIGVLLPLAGLCFAANVCFCLGPVLNGYARWMGFRHGIVTILIFAAGTTIAAMLKIGAVAALSDDQF